MMETKKNNMKQVIHQTLQLLYADGKNRKEILISNLTAKEIEYSLLELILDLFDSPSRKNIDMILDQCVKLELIDSQLIKIKFIL